MFESGLLTAVLGAAPRPVQLVRLAAIESVLGLAADALLRLAALAVEIPEDAERLGARWRLSSAETAALLRVAGRAPELGPAVPERRARAHLYTLREATYRKRVLIAWARSGDDPASAAWRERWHLPDRWPPPRLPVGGADVLALGVPPGPEVGVILAALEGWWIGGDFSADEAALRATLEELAKPR
jgi:poly(A) polymerase